MNWTIKLFASALPLIFALTVTGQQPVPSSDVNAAFSLAITVAPANAKAGDDVLVTIKLQNTSNSVYQLPIALEYKRAEANGFVPEVIDLNGVKIPRKHRPEDDRRRAESRTMVGIKPGAVFEEKLDLSKLFDLTTPGSYKVVVHRVDRQNNVKVKSNIVTFNIEP
jgi:hypothetical protein